MKKLVNNILITYHIAMRDFYSREGYFQNDMKIIYHDMKLQRLLLKQSIYSKE